MQKATPYSGGETREQVKYALTHTSGIPTVPQDCGVRRRIQKMDDELWLRSCRKLHKRGLLRLPLKGQIEFICWTQLDKRQERLSRGEGTTLWKQNGDEKEHGPMFQELNLPA